VPGRVKGGSWTPGLFHVVVGLRPTGEVIRWAVYFRSEPRDTGYLLVSDEKEVDEWDRRILSNVSNLPCMCWPNMCIVCSVHPTELVRWGKGKGCSRCWHQEPVEFATLVLFLLGLVCSNCNLLIKSLCFLSEGACRLWKEDCGLRKKRR
jgi:hypothetical protein